MEVSYSTLLTAMDTLWFNHIVLLSQPICHLYSTTFVSQDSVETSHSEDDCTSTVSSSTSTSKDDCSYELEEEKAPEHAERSSRFTRLTLISNKTRSQSSSPSIHRPRKSSSHLQRFSSSKTMHDLEQLELKGFIDLGFHFEKELLSPRTMNVLPGLQRLGEQETCSDETDAFTTVMDDDNNGEAEKGVMGPYLSEAWLVKKPNSPLLRLKMARVSTAQDMKNCLKLWARTVASSVLSEK